MRAMVASTLVASGLVGRTVWVRQVASWGVCRAQSGSWTRRAREAKFAPNADAIAARVTAIVAVGALFDPAGAELVAGWTVSRSP